MPIEIVPAQAGHDEALKQVIQKVGEEFGAVGDGFGPADAEVQHMSVHYTGVPRHQYLMVLEDEEVLGGCGISPFQGSETVCELRKMFLLPQARGRGIGKALLQRNLTFAAESEYLQCYLDTLSGMEAAIQLYQSFGFRRLDTPMAGTDHDGCDVWMLKAL